ncbi:MAG: alpha-E domain-containing protein [Candidatus Competibacteraceae bacterium]|nr:alpha-E domain-containing protein [Candidatus Competibacteraceae bacterium]
MLSRVAQNIYWMARYIERVEDTARLISVNDILLLDLPHGSLGWEPLVFISGSQDLFLSSKKDSNELNIIQFLVGDRNNSVSILSSLSYARENLRTTRDVVPREAWEQINSLYMYVRDHLVIGMSRRGRHEFLKRIIHGTQQVTGMLAGTMSHTHAYDFVRLGRNLERADMTTRILDVRSANLLVDKTSVVQSQDMPGQSQTQEQLLEQDPVELNPFENIQWMSVLKSLSAYQMYRQHIRLRVRGPDVLQFLLQNRHFPRSVLHCLGELDECLHDLPKNTVPLDWIAQLNQRLEKAQIAELAREGLHEFIDDLQIGLGALHEHLVTTYFDHA